MLRVAIFMLAAVGLGWLGGTTQSTLATRGFDERFVDSRETLDERRGKITRDELIEQSTGTPKLEVVGGSEFDFGTMRRGETMSHEFIVRNVGDGPLGLEMGESTCKCTVGDLKSSLLQPGEEAVVELTWTAKTIISEFGQSATLITTDPTQSEAKLIVSGLVVDSLVTEPATIVLGDMASAQGAERTFYVMSYLEDATELQNLAWSDSKTAEYVELEHKKIPIDVETFPAHRNCSSMYEVKLKVKPGMPLGGLSMKIQFETNLGEDVGTINVPVTGKVIGDITFLGGRSFNADQSRVDFGTVPSAQGDSVTIFMRVNSDSLGEYKPVIHSISPEESLQASMGEPKLRGTTTLFPIQLEIPKGAAPVNLTGPGAKRYGKVVVKTDADADQEIPIYVRMAVTD